MSIDVMTITNGLSESWQRLIQARWDENEKRLDTILRNEIQGVCEGTSPVAIAHTLLRNTVEGPATYSVYIRGNIATHPSGYCEEVGILVKPYETEVSAQRAAFGLLHTLIEPAPNICSLKRYPVSLEQTIIPLNDASRELAEYLAAEAEAKQRWVALRGISASPDFTELELPQLFTPRDNG